MGTCVDDGFAKEMSMEVTYVKNLYISSFIVVFSIQDAFHCEKFDCTLAITND